MQRQTNVLNLFVEFRFQLFSMKTLFYFELRVSAGMIENLKTRDITLIPVQPLEALRCLKMWEFLSRKRCSLTRVLKCLLVSPI